MKNRLRGKCLGCKKVVEVGEGHFERKNGKWEVRCKKCVGK